MGQMYSALDGVMTKKGTCVITGKPYEASVKEADYAAWCERGRDIWASYPADTKDWFLFGISREGREENYNKMRYLLLRLTALVKEMQKHIRYQEDGVSALGIDVENHLEFVELLEQLDEVNYDLLEVKVGGVPVDLRVLGEAVQTLAVVIVPEGNLEYSPEISYRHVPIVEYNGGRFMPFLDKDRQTYVLSLPDPELLGAAE